MLGWWLDGDVQVSTESCHSVLSHMSLCLCFIVIIVAQGFGFIDMGGVTVFVHYTQCEEGKQPKVGDVLTFSLEPRRSYMHVYICLLSFLFLVSFQFSLWFSCVGKYCSNSACYEDLLGHLYHSFPIFRHHPFYVFAHGRGFPFQPWLNPVILHAQLETSPQASAAQIVQEKQPWADASQRS